jgi:hypothetical protein
MAAEPMLWLTSPALAVLMAPSRPPRHAGRPRPASPAQACSRAIVYPVVERARARVLPPDRPASPRSNRKQAPWS